MLQQMSINCCRISTRFQKFSITAISYTGTRPGVHTSCVHGCCHQDHPELGYMLICKSLVQFGLLGFLFGCLFSLLPLTLKQKNHNYQFHPQPFPKWFFSWWKTVPDTVLLSGREAGTTAILCQQENPFYFRIKLNSVI